MKPAKRCLLCLRELPLFRGLDRSEFRQVCLTADKRRLARGQVVFRQGEPADSIYLVKAGKLKLVRVTGEGREAILDVVGPGEVLGETALFREEAQSCAAVALEETSLCCFGRPQFETLIQKNPSLALNMIGYLGRRLHESRQEMGDAAGASVRERVLRLMRRLAEKYGRTAPHATVIELEITQQELADMVGASRVMVGNVLKELNELGVVSRHGRRYLLKPDACLARNFPEEEAQAAPPRLLRSC